MPPLPPRQQYGQPARRHDSLSLCCFSYGTQSSTVWHWASPHCAWLMRAYPLTDTNYFAPGWLLLATLQKCDPKPPVDNPQARAHVWLPLSHISILSPPTVRNLFYCNRLTTTNVSFFSQPDFAFKFVGSYLKLVDFPLLVSLPALVVLS